jgi:hypothetical protein
VWIVPPRKHISLGTLSLTMPRHGGLLSEKVVLPDTEFLDRTMRAEEIPVASDSRPVESPRSSSRTDSSLSPWKTGVRESVSPRLATPEVSSLRDRLFDICLFLSFQSGFPASPYTAFSQLRLT